MPFLFTCPHCGTTTQVDDWYAGLSGPCAACQRAVTMPGDAPAPAVTALQQSRSTGTKSVALVIWMVLGALLACIATVYLLVAILAPVFSSVQAQSNDAQCCENLQRIAAALHSYHDDYDAFPPAYVADDKGRPMHSWRVLILPYLGYQRLYESYDLSQPWDAPQNVALLNAAPDVFQCPADASHGTSITSYVLVTGPGTLFDGTNAKSISDVTDDPARTIVLVEQSEAMTDWLAPTDLDFRELISGIYGGTRTLDGNHPHGTNVATLDGNVHILSDSATAEHVKGLVTISGKEALPPDVLPENEAGTGTAERKRGR